MARVIALTRDLLFGSQLQGMLAAAGHEVELLGTPELLAARLSQPDRQAQPTVLIADLTDPDLDAAPALVELAARATAGKLRTIAFYAHVDTSARLRAEQAGSEVVVPRSRMAREGAALVARSLAPR